MIFKMVFMSKKLVRIISAVGLFKWHDAVFWNSRINFIHILKDVANNRNYLITTKPNNEISVRILSDVLVRMVTQSAITSDATPWMITMGDHRKGEYSHERQCEEGKSHSNGYFLLTLYRWFCRSAMKCSGRMIIGALAATGPNSIAAPLSASAVADTWNS